jgi:hypothetical protein
MRRRSCRDPPYSRLRFAYWNQGCLSVLASPMRGGLRKFVVFFGYFASLLFVAMLSKKRMGRLSFAVGVAGAGVAVAQQDVMASIAGAFSIGFSRLYTAGDRVQIGDIRGDVIDIARLERVRLQLLARFPVYLGRD